MTDVTKRVDAFLAEYGMDPARVDLDQCARAFQADMERGLRGDPEARMPMLPAYLAPEGDIPQDQPAIVIDAGGTNFRIGLVSLGARGPEIQDLRVFPMPGSQGPITWEEFVDQVSEAVLPLTGRSRRVGLCFSYAAEILPNGDGRVLRFSKQVQVEGSEGKELGRDLSAALAEKGAPGVTFSVLNDTVAALLGGVAALRDEVFDGFIGLIYGTGVNTCYAERREKLSRVTTPWEKGSMLINMESARFDGAPLSEFDRRLDARSVDPVLCAFILIAIPPVTEALSAHWGEFIRLLGFSSQSSFHFFLLYMVVLTFIGAVVNVVSIQSAVILGQLFNGHKVLGAVVSYFVLTTISSIAATILMGIYGLLTDNLIIGTVGNSDFTFASYMTNILNLSFALEIVFAIILYIISYIIMKKKINLS